MPRPKVLVTCLFLSSVLALTAPGKGPQAAPVGYLYSAGEPTGDAYEDQVLGAGTTEGDVWGGEQGTVPAEEPGAGIEPVDPEPGRDSWFTALARLFARLSASLWFTNPD